MSEEKASELVAYGLAEALDGAIRTADGYNYYIDSEYADEIISARFPMVAASGDMLAALEGLSGILSRAESNASGMPEWESVSARINAARAAIAKARGEVA